MTGRVWPAHWARRRPSIMAMFELRPYQQAALTALEDYWRDGGGNPLVVMATATGKSVVIAHLIRDISRRYPALRVLVVTHVLELIEQDLIPLRTLWPDAPIGINSAGIGEREWGAPIIFAGVQSVWRSAARLGPRHLGQRFLGSNHIRRPRRACRTKCG